MKATFKKRTVKMLLAALLVLTLIPFTAIISSAEESFVAKVGETPYATLSEAVAAANQVAEGAVVLLGADVTLGEMITVTGKVTLQGQPRTVTEGEVTTSKNPVILRASDYTGALFKVEKGGELTVGSNVVIDGNNNWLFDREGFQAALYNTEGAQQADDLFVTSAEGSPEGTEDMFLNYGTLTLQGRVQNSLIPKGHIIGAYADALTVLDGAYITHVANKTNGAIYSSSINKQTNQTLIMKAGTVITENYGGRNGGLFHVQAVDSTFIMDGGEIVNNYAYDSNGSVVMIYGEGSRFEMNGGLIQGNAAVYGTSNGRNSAIYAHSRSTFVMNDGVITQNIGRGIGGVDIRSGAKEVTIHNGYIAENIGAFSTSGGDIRVDLRADGSSPLTQTAWVKNFMNAIVVTSTGGTQIMKAENKLAELESSLNELTVAMMSEEGDPVALQESIDETKKAIDEAIEACKTYSDQSDSTLKEELLTKITEATTALNAAIAKLQEDLDRKVADMNAALETTRQDSQAALDRANTFNAITAIIVCVSHAGVIALSIRMIVDRNAGKKSARKRSK